MAKTRILFCALLFVFSSITGARAGGDAFTGYQIDTHGQYFSFLGVRAPLTDGKSTIQPFIQVFGAGLGYTFKVNGQHREADVQSATPSVGLKYLHGSWTFIGLAGPQFRWKQEDQTGGNSRTEQHDVGAYLQGEAFYWDKLGTFHAIASYTDLDQFVWGRIRGTHLVHQADSPCCSVYLGGDLAGMGNRDFYAVQAGPLVQITIERFYFTVKGGYQYTQTFQHGGYGGVELYLPF